MEFNQSQFVFVYCREFQLPKLLHTTMYVGMYWLGQRYWLIEENNLKKVGSAIGRASNFLTF